MYENDNFSLEKYQRKCGESSDSHNDSDILDGK